MRLVDLVSGLLEREDGKWCWAIWREAGEGEWQGLAAVVGLVARRELAIWKSWRPFVAAFGVALPSSFPLMGLSVWVGRLLLDPRPGFALGLSNGDVFRALFILFGAVSHRVLVAVLSVVVFGSGDLGNHR